jgi:hypothetical protein
MSAIQIGRAVVLGAAKVVLFAVGVYAICAAALGIERASFPTSKDMCDRVEVGMTLSQIEDATSAIEGWQVLRDDGVMVISAGGRGEKPVCRVAIDSHTHRATSKSVGPIQQGDWPTL